MDGSRDPRGRVDLHGLGRDAALRRVRETLTRARALGLPLVRIVTGRGLGNRTGVPVLRRAVETWLRSAEASGLGVVQVTRKHGGGALEVQLRRNERGA